MYPQQVNEKEIFFLKTNQQPCRNGPLCGQVSLGFPNHLLWSVLPAVWLRKKRVPN